jgi:hypothetical protein
MVYNPSPPFPLIFSLFPERSAPYKKDLALALPLPAMG